MIRVPGRAGGTHAWALRFGIQIVARVDVGM